MEQVQPDGTAGRVDDRDRVDPVGTHEVEGVGAAAAGRHGEEVGVERDLERVIEGGAAQERAAQVAVGGDAHEAAVLVHREGGPGRTPIQGGQPVADRARARDDRARPALSHAGAARVPGPR